MRILVTGGAGFIGSHLAARILDDGDSVLVLDDLSTGSVANVVPLLKSDRFSFLIGSVLDAPLVDRLVAHADQVFHLAAVVGVMRVLENPGETFRRNVAGADAVLHAAARHGRKVVFASSSEVYGPGTGTLTAAGLGEGDAAAPGSLPAGPRWAYARSKLACEALAARLAAEEGLAAVAVRLFNTIGPGQSGEFGMVVPRFVRQALAGEPITVFGSGRQTRCFTWVGDTVESLRALMAAPAAAGLAVNVGSREEVSIHALARRIAVVAGSAAPIRLLPYRDAYGPGFEDALARRPDVSLLARLAGQVPATPLDHALRAILAAARAGGSGPRAAGRALQHAP